MRLAKLLHASECPPRLSARLIRGKALLTEALFHQRQVQLDLVIEHLILATPAKQRSAPGEQRAYSVREEHRLLLRREPQHALNDGGNLLPTLLLARQLTTSSGSDRIETRFAVAFGDPPGRPNPAALAEAKQPRIDC